jgi:hypothetical protein
MRAASCPTAYINQVMQPVTGYTRASMEQGGVRYIIPGLRQAVVALRNVAWWSDATRARYAETPPAPVPVPAPGRRRGKWSEHATRALLAEAAPDGARIEGVLVSPMRRGGTELLVGIVPDPQWGPVLAVAIGGLFVEVLRDSALAPLPVTPGQAGRLLDRLRGRAVLDGVRGAAPADRDALTAVIARIGDLALALGDDLESLEVNPLLVDGTRIEALDAVVTWREHS